MDRALIDAAVQALVVEAVFLRTSSIRCKEGFLPRFIEDNLSLTPQYRVGSADELRLVDAKNKNTEASTKTAVFHFNAGVRLVDSASTEAVESQEDIPDEAVFIEIETEFCAQYGLDDDIDEEELRPALIEFARYNVGYHVWPYWREYVQTTCARMGFPPIPIPMFRIPQPESSAEQLAD